MKRTIQMKIFQSMTAILFLGLGLLIQSNISFADQRVILQGSDKEINDFMSRVKPANNGSSCYPGGQLNDEVPSFCVHPCACCDDPNNPSCNKKTLVILVHGVNFTGAPDDATSILLNQLPNNECLYVSAFLYDEDGDDKDKCVGELGTKLAETINAAAADMNCPHCKIIVLAHSAGGYIAADAASKINDPATFDTFDTPFGGFGVPGFINPVGDGCFVTQVGQGDYPFNPPSPGVTLTVHEGGKFGMEGGLPPGSNYEDKYKDEDHDQSMVKPVMDPALGIIPKCDGCPDDDDSGSGSGPGGPPPGQGSGPSSGTGGGGGPGGPSSGSGAGVGASGHSGSGRKGEGPTTGGGWLEPIGGLPACRPSLEGEAMTNTENGGCYTCMCYINPENEDDWLCGWEITDPSACD